MLLHQRSSRNKNNRPYQHQIYYLFIYRLTERKIISRTDNPAHTTSSQFLFVRLIPTIVLLTCKLFDVILNKQTPPLIITLLSADKSWSAVRQNMIRDCGKCGAVLLSWPLVTSGVFSTYLCFVLDDGELNDWQHDSSECDVIEGARVLLHQCAWFWTIRVWKRQFYCVDGDQLILDCAKIEDLLLEFCCKYLQNVLVVVCRLISHKTHVFFRFYQWRNNVDVVS